MVDLFNDGSTSQVSNHLYSCDAPILQIEVQFDCKSFF